MTRTPTGVRGRVARGTADLTGAVTARDSRTWVSLPPLPRVVGVAPDSAAHLHSRTPTPPDSYVRRDETVRTEPLGPQAGDGRGETDCTRADTRRGR